MTDCLPPWYVGLLHAADDLPAHPNYPDPADRRAYTDGYRAGTTPTNPARAAHRRGQPQ